MLGGEDVTFDRHNHPMRCIPLSLPKREGETWLCEVWGSGEGHKPGKWVSD